VSAADLNGQAVCVEALANKKSQGRIAVKILQSSEPSRSILVKPECLSPCCAQCFHRGNEDEQEYARTQTSSKQKTGIKLRLCGGCNSLYFCSQDCQKAYWPTHRSVCKLLREEQLKVPIPGGKDIRTAEELQAFVDKAPPGSTIELGGVFIESEAALVINKPLTLRGTGKSRIGRPLFFMPWHQYSGEANTDTKQAGFAESYKGDTCLSMPIVIVDASAKESSASTEAKAAASAAGKTCSTVLESFISFKGIKVKSCSSFELKLQHLYVTNTVFAPNERFGPQPQDIITIEAPNSSVSLSHVEVYGGSDGLFLSSAKSKAHIESCKISGYIRINTHYTRPCTHKHKHMHTHTLPLENTGCHNRGIFSDLYFDIKDSEISNCNGYGIKDRAGHSRLGRNNIQPGPWDNAGGMYY